MKEKTENTASKLLQWVQLFSLVVVVTLAYSDLKHALTDNTKAIQSLVEQLKTVETRFDTRLESFPTKKQTEEMGMLFVQRYHATNDLESDTVRKQIRYIFDQK